MVVIVTALYTLSSKFTNKTYIQWCKNFISIVNHFNLIIYTNKDDYLMLKKLICENNKIKIRVKEIENLYNYRYKKDWIKNHEKNSLLKDRICWEVNMLWSEKIRFVKRAYDKKYFGEHEWYIWCDVGYFRNRENDLHTSNLSNWCHTMDTFDKTKIHYGLINENIQHIIDIVKDENNVGLPKNPIPADQVSIAGGFFMIHKTNINWWFNTYDDMLSNYFKHGYLVKDDQIIVIHCIVKHMEKIQLHRENNRYDHWFMFQRILS
jgi:hypothetical protein